MFRPQTHLDLLKTRSRSSLPPLRFLRLLLVPLLCRLETAPAPAPELEAYALGTVSLLPNRRYLNQYQEIVSTAYSLLLAKDVI